MEDFETSFVRSSVLCITSDDTGELIPLYVELIHLAASCEEEELLFCSHVFFSDLTALEVPPKAVHELNKLEIAHNSTTV